MNSIEYIPKHGFVLLLFTGSFTVDSMTISEKKVNLSIVTQFYLHWFILKQIYNSIVVNYFINSSAKIASVVEIFKCQISEARCQQLFVIENHHFSDAQQTHTLTHRRTIEGMGEKERT